MSIVVGLWVPEANVDATTSKALEDALWSCQPPAVETIKTEGVILRAYPLAEKDRIVVAYTRDLGKISGVIPRIVRSAGYGLGQVAPYGYVELMLRLQPHRDLLRIQNIELLRAFGAMLPSYQNFLQLSLVAEILLETTPEREPNDDLFRLLLLVLPCFADPTRAPLAGLYFKIWYLKISGLLPANRICQSCQNSFTGREELFVAENFTGFRCGACRKRADRRLSVQAHLLLAAIRQKSLPDLHREWEESRSVAELAEMSEAMLEFHFERHFQTLQLLRAEGAGLV
ncbi:MAG: DNA repair protein RecO [Terriglobia bacterium]